VFAAAVEYSQFSDSYRPVPVSAEEFQLAAASATAISVLAAVVPGSAGAVPRMARFPLTAPCQPGAGSSKRRHRPALGHQMLEDLHVGLGVSGQRATGEFRGDRERRFQLVTASSELPRTSATSEPRRCVRR
jgi:hypothetical protein